MGGVNLVEESQRILASNAEIVGTQIRSCKDENFVFTGALQRRINMIAAKYGLGDTPSDVLSLISHATQERLKTLVEKLGIIAEHRVENIKNDPRYEVTQDVKAQLKFLEELDRIEKKKHEEQEREMLLRAAKSRSKLEDPEQLKLKQKAKEMQRAEMEEMRQREANMTALLAIGPRKKLKPDPLGIGLNQQLGQSSPSGINNTIVKPQVWNSSCYENYAWTYGKIYTDKGDIAWGVIAIRSSCNCAIWKN
ncbi:transcription initiation factor TFIID subunit 4-like [Centruroides sculpturatus]|uniref:transcription initiation factor TFIID subunit 4-like n=1 Tax=Centruroides sculpturatus TaxID=218467 RepID=UPI000C6E1597|nr:transcription initiation factor TFIID subunit 4-like [Centruroides sculpturatus]